MRYLSVCSGIEAASVAWHHLGWEPVGFSEIEPFPAAVLAHRFPNIPNYGDMTKHEQWPIERGAIDLLVGGTPCQSFSVAGLRQGLADPRGNLMLTYLAIADRLRPRWLVWENVPGVLSSNGGRDFGTFLGALGQLGYGWAYRVLDAQYVRVGRWPRAVPQRRRRVFVVGCLGDWTAAGEVLALAEGLQRHIEARRAKGKGVATDAEGGVGAGCWWDGGQVSETLNQSKCGGGGVSLMPDKGNFGAVLQPTAYRWQNDRDGLQQDDAVAALRASQGASGFHEMNHPVIAQPVAFTQNCREEVRDLGDASSALTGQGTHQQTYIAQPVPYDLFQITAPVNRQNRAPGDPCHTLAKDNAAHAAVAFHPTQTPISSTDGSTHCMGTGSSRGDATIAVAQAMTVRRLRPRECERLQGFPDDWTMIPYRGKPAEQCPDGPRYKALGNSMACNCMAWIGERIAAYEAQNGST
jgi:DNA (cytosine-5)-methyltransferase 1